ncbi:MAG: hypothetical protein LBL56_04800, partial [Treponema sp.]|nr:hypothetical protein [Treponema sp.]
PHSRRLLFFGREYIMFKRNFWVRPALLLPVLLAVALLTGCPGTGPESEPTPPPPPQQRR